MLVTLYFILLVIATIAVTYPDDFPQLIRDPKLFYDSMSMETRRRWMIAKLGSQLWIERKKMAFSLWKMRGIIKAEQQKQQQQNTNDR